MIQDLTAPAGATTSPGGTTFTASTSGAVPVKPEEWRTAIYVPAHVINLDMSPGAFALYVRSFLRHRNRETGTAWMSRDTMLAESGVGVNTLTAKLAELKSLGLITKGKRKGQNGTYEYTIPLPDSPVSGTHETVTPTSFSDSRFRDSWDSRFRDTNHRQRTMEEGEKATTTFPGGTTPTGSNVANERNQGGGGGGFPSSQFGEQEERGFRRLAKAHGQADGYRGTAKERQAYLEHREELDSIPDGDLETVRAWYDDPAEAKRHMVHLAAFLARLPAQVTMARKWLKSRPKPSVPSGPIPEPDFDWRTAMGIIKGNGVSLGQSRTWDSLHRKMQINLIENGLAALRGEFVPSGPVPRGTVIRFEKPTRHVAEGGAPC